MLLRIDGHEIPIATADDPTDEELAAHNTRRVWDPDNAGHVEMVVPTGSTPGKSVPFNMQHGDDKSRGASFTIVPPVGDDDQELDLASLRPVRVVGHNYAKADRKHQRRLFLAVGAVTVAGGHVEMALRKVLVALTGGENKDLASKDVPADWNVLHKKISKLCEIDASELAQRVAEYLNAAETAGLRDTRNNIVHSNWWLTAFDSGELWSGRYHRGGKQPMCISDTAENLYKIADKMFDFAASLESLVTPRFALAIVPAAPTPHNQGVISLVARIDRIDELADNNETHGPDASAAAKPKPGQKPSGRSIRKRKSASDATPRRSQRSVPPSPQAPPSPRRDRRSASGRRRSRSCSASNGP